MSKTKNVDSDAGAKRMSVNLPPIFYKKKQRGLQKLAHVLSVVLDAVAAAEFAKDDGELWNECKALVEEVQRGR